MRIHGSQPVREPSRVERPARVDGYRARQHHLAEGTVADPRARIPDHLPVVLGAGVLRELDGGEDAMG